MLLGVVLVLLAVWLGYYFMYYQPSWGVRRDTARPAKKYQATTASTTSAQKSAPQTTNPPSAKSKKTEATQPKPKKQGSGEVKPKESKKSNVKSSPTAAKNSEPQYLNIAEVPVLRRPVPADDPDRPFIIEILTGDNLINDGQYSDAVQTFNSILKQFPQSPRASYGKAVALDHLAEAKKKSKLQDTAMDFYYNVAFESIIASDDLKLNALIRLADRAHHQQKFGLEIKALTKASNMEPTNSRYATKLGIAYLRAKRMDEAKIQLQEVRDKWPEASALAAANLGYMYYLDNQCEQALPLLMAGIDSEDAGTSRNPKFYNYVGDCLVRLNRTTEV